MMVYENDKFNIPEKYREMSVSELKAEKEKVYSELRSRNGDVSKKKSYTKGNVTLIF